MHERNRQEPGISARARSERPMVWGRGRRRDRVLRARGGGKVDVEWKTGRLTELRLQSDHVIKYRVSYGDHSTEVQVLLGKPIVLDGTLHRMSQ